VTEGVRLLVGLIVGDGFGKDIFDGLVFGNWNNTDDMFVGGNYVCVVTWRNMVWKEVILHRGVGKDRLMLLDVSGG